MKQFTETLPEIALEMVIIPTGEFLMGSPDSDSDAQSREKPQHLVKVNSFAIGKYPVTQAQYEAIIKDNFYWNDMQNFDRNFFPDRIYPQNPVEHISWNDAQAFCEKLAWNTQKKYRLPTEAEWEYACRAGTTSRYYFGDDAEQLGDYAWYKGNSQDKTHSVGQKKPNAWGLYDMIGNVWEWCEDNWHNSYIEAPSDGSAWINDGGNFRDKVWINNENNDFRIQRGGFWDSHLKICRSACRVYATANTRETIFSTRGLGFRVACDL